MANPFQGDDEDPFSGVRDEEGGIKRAAPKKNRIVTKEELKKSGFTNLRDFLNAERGLKRRDGKPAEKGPDTATLDRIARKQAEEDKGPSKSEIDRMAKKFDSKDRPGSEVLAEKMEKGQPKMQGAYREAFGNIRKALGFKSGGSVKMSGASKRADGCAKRGKTRGRMV